ncbi:MAG: hypothetical protein ACI841_000119 [Planctomycetota bacterium]|jgi:hypothetical protein
MKTAIASALLCATAFAQFNVPSHHVTFPVKSVGTSHFATGEWTRAQSQRALGPDTIYNNTGV